MLFSRPWIDLINIKLNKNRGDLANLGFMACKSSKTNKNIDDVRKEDGIVRRWVLLNSILREFIINTNTSTSIITVRYFLCFRG